MSERKIEPLNPANHQIGDFARTLHVITAGEHANPNDLLDPAYWASVSVKFRPFDRIEARAADGTWLAEYVVQGCDRTWAKVAMLNQYILTTGDVALTQAEQTKFEVKWAGPNAKFRVIRKSDSKVLHEGEQTRDGAETWLREYAKTVG